VRRLSPGGHDVVAGFAGSTADAFTLLERLERSWRRRRASWRAPSVELAKDWRTDKYLQNLEAMLIVTDGALFVITGAGDVLEPEHDVAAIGSGGNFALAAARGLMATDLTAEDVARRAMAIAADICVYTNGNLTVETDQPDDRPDPARDCLANLDRFIIGQREAKRAVAVALRNRWRRKQLAPPCARRSIPRTS
jgi:ATP-dependent HslUV protease, peptidase subunit HslV